MALVAMKCPACGADIELDNSSEFGFCSFCGSKVMQEKIVVEHQGNVKIDNSEYVEKFLQNARRAKEKEDWEETEKYYNLVEQNDPQNIEAIFYSSYGKAKSSLVDDDLYKRQAVFNTLNKCVSILDDNYNAEESDENENIIRQISDDILELSYSTFVFTEWKDGYGNIKKTNKHETFLLFAKLNAEFVTTLENIIAKDEKAVYYELAIKHCSCIMNNSTLSIDTRNNYKNIMLNFHTKWHEFDANHEIPAIEDVQEEKKSGCYVATAVYGSYDCPQVWLLRRYRDFSLAETIYGRAFIKTYYAISPTLVKWFGSTVWFKNMWKAPLDKMVSRLAEKGFEDTPYEDKIW